MDAPRAREQLRRRYLFPPDTEAPLDSEGYAGPGEALPRARPEPRRGGRSRGARKRPAPRASRSPALTGGIGFRFSRLAE